jgi:hypothetical protein
MHDQQHSLTRLHGPGCAEAGAAQRRWARRFLTVVAVSSVLSPWPLDEARKLLLPHAAFGTRAHRAATSAVVHRGSLRIRAVAVHLPALGAISDDERQEQVRLIIDDAARSAAAVAVGGDFNGRAAGRWFRDRGFL